MMNEAYFNSKKKHIYETVKHSLETVPYYQDKYQFQLPSLEEFSYEFFNEHVPFLEKDDLRKDTDSFISRNFEKEDLHFGITSGTSGNPLVCYKSKGEYLRASNDLWRQRRFWVPDLTPSDRFARFYAFRQRDNALVMNQILSKEDEIQIPLYDYSEDRLEEYWVKLLEFKPRWMHGPATAIFNLAKYGKQTNLEKVDIELIELNGEYVEPEQVKIIQEVFNCKVTNHYGSREFWGLGFSCENGHLHILDHSVFIETIPNAETSSNELVITSLKNKAWPLIRYKIGDIGEVYLNQNCNCNLKGSFCLDLKKGRKADYFTLVNGKHLNAILFSGIIRGLSTMENKSVIYQYQVVKKSDDLLEIYLCMNEENKEGHSSLIQTINEELKKVTGENISIKYIVTDYIEPDKLTGKCRDFIDESN